MYNSIKEEFPEIRQRDGLLGITIPAPDQDTRTMETIELVQFWNASKTLLVQSGKDILTINSLKPYPNWEQFFPGVIKTFDTYLKIAKPKGLGRVSLRYINTIEAPVKNFKFENTFKVQIPKPKNLNQELRYFNTHIEYNISERDVIAIKTSNAPSQSTEMKNMIFQLDVIMNKFNGLTFESVSEWLNEAHKIIIDTFEASIDDQLKKTYE